jgi:cytochrome oxidase Cu insertion factor (SCO1/SenC/PrrC family)
MSRSGFRVLGIFLGLFAGTMAAMVSINVRRSQRNGVDTAATLTPAESSNTESEPSDEPEIDAPPPDPGDRRRLVELKNAVKSEPNWTRSFSLTERSGRTVRSEDLLGEPYVVCFFFTTCPGTCKRQSSEMRLLQSKFKDKPIKLVSISVDPEVDTPEVLTQYAENFNADEDRWLFLTGSLDDIVRVGTEMFFLSGVERRGHPDRFCLVDAKGELVGSYVWLEPEERQRLVDHIEELLATN